MGESDCCGLALVLRSYRNEVEINVVTNAFGDLGALRSKPIDGIPEALQKKAGYREHHLQLESAYSDEELVSIDQYGLAGVNFYNSSRLPPHYDTIPGSIPELLLRETVAQKLQRVNQKLQSVGLELWVMDAWRPIEVQDYTHDVWMPNFLKSIKHFSSDEEMWREVEQYSAKGSNDGQIDPLSPPPHSTGAAVDLTIRWIGQDHLYMGSIFDDFTSRANTDFYETNIMDHSFSDYEARNNRRLLYWMMSNEGFSNNPTEWWHFSWGDQMWARLQGEPSALYSCLKP